MYLTCPNCETVYAVRAAMLHDGQGEVRCGTCRLVFNALDSLSDELPAARVASQAAAGDPSAKTMDAGEDVEQVTTNEGTDKAATRQRAPQFASSVRGAITHTLRDDLENLHDSNVPVARNTGLWLAALLGLLTLAFQYLWFAPEDLMQRFPMARTQVGDFCLRMGCMTRPDRAPNLVRVLSRDVRAHPRYEGALLVTATFSNAASWAQPFPRLRFSLYDVNGKTIAARTFSPGQYLAGVLPANASLPPGQPVQVALEMLAPEEAAVSFEFTFL